MCNTVGRHLPQRLFTGQSRRAVCAFCVVVTICVVLTGVASVPVHAQNIPPVVANGPGATANVPAGSVVETPSFGANATNGGTITIGGPGVDTFITSTQNIAVQAFGANSTITAANAILAGPNSAASANGQNARIELTGGSATGLATSIGAQLGGTVTLMGTEVIANGDAAMLGSAVTGIAAANNGTVNMTGGSVDSTFTAIQVVNNSTVTMTNVTMVHGNAFGIFNLIGNNAVNLVDTNVTAPTAIAVGQLSGIPGMPALPGTLQVNVSGGSITGNTALLSVGGGSTLNLTASDAARLAGDAIVSPGGTANINLMTNANWRGAATNVTEVTTASGGNWTVTGDSTVGTVMNGGAIQFTPPANGMFKTLTTMTYVGQGGLLGLNTFLGADSSPSDKLVIVNNGTASGTTSLRITNAGGPGAQTNANGIQVVEALGNATTQVPGAPATFTLAGEVRGGVYDYDLFRGSLNGSDPSLANDWFLRSTFLGNGGNGGNGPVTPPGELPTEPAPDNGLPPPPGVWPIIGPELATYGVVQPIARQMGLTTLGTLHERVGDAAADTACLNATSDDGALITKAPPVPYNCRSAVWGRLFGQQIDNHYQAFADPRATGQIAGIQSGADIWRGSLIPGHSDNAGVYFAYSNGNVDVNGLVTNAAATAYVLQHTGSVNLNAFSVGGYWTHYGPTGWYIDAVLQGSFYNGNAATQFANLPLNGTGFTSSLETGYPIPLPWLGPLFVLEPEGQIIWQQVSFRDDNDGLGPVGLGTTSGASGRLGLRGKWTISDPAGRVWQPYVLANVWRDWGANATTMFGIDSVPLREEATRLEFAGGLSAKLLPGLSLYAQAGYQFAVSGTDGGRRDGVRGDLGVHYTW